MQALSTRYSTIAGYNASKITIANSPSVGTYTGSFIYDTAGNVYTAL